jgi:hypothetical protein
MGILINGQKFSKPLVDGIPHNILINGQKIFKDSPALNVSLIPKGSLGYGWTDADYFNQAAYFHDGNMNTYAENSTKPSLSWLTINLSGKMIDKIVLQKVVYGNHVDTGAIILTNIPPVEDATPTNALFLRQANSGSGLIENVTIDNPDKTTKFQYLSFGVGAQESQFYELDIYEILPVFTIN